MITLNTISRLPVLSNALFAFVLLIFSNALCAQEGHPLNGTWSGNRIVNGQTTRVLIIFNLQPDQVIEGTLLENGNRIPLQDVTLNPLDWTVSMKASGTDKAGNNFSYEIAGALDNLGSATNRTLDGKWIEGETTGTFRIFMN